MIFPVEIFGIHAHLIFELLAYFLGYRFYQYLRGQTKDRIADSDRLWIFIAAALGGLIGSRLVGVLEHPEHLEHLSFALILSNKTVLGGFLGGLFFVEFAKKLLGVRVSSGDLMVYPLLLALVIGRIGCFLEGLDDGTFGVASSLPWAIDFGDGIRRHPTQLYELLFVLILAFSIYALEKRYTFENGFRFQFFLFSYFVFRFLIEFLKPMDDYIYGLGAIQMASLFGIGYYVLLFKKVIKW
jgi:phosphatidylglycerol:prolipoprotein diacylglycerol transferase